jgi:nucleotide-binding universal stress UspA family protein
MSKNGAAADVAPTRPWPPGTLFCLLHIVVPVYPPLIVPRVFERSNKTLLEQLSRAAEPLERVGWSVQTTVLAGSPRRTINAFAKGWQADLIMVGSHERSPLARLCLGGTAQSVMRHAPCSVEIVGSRRHSSGSAGDHRLKILVATDGSEFSAAALRSVAKRPWPDGSELKVISVPEFILTKEASYLTTDEIREIGDLGAAAIEDAKRCIATGKEILSGSPLSVSAEVPDYLRRRQTPSIRLTLDSLGGKTTEFAHGEAGRGLSASQQQGWDRRAFCRLRSRGRAQERRDRANKHISTNSVHSRYSR